MKYRNGNADIVLLKDGTRIITTEDEDFNFEYPLNMDVKVSNRCGVCCPMCHERSVPDGDVAPLANFEFMKHWLPGSEVAFGGGSVTEHPEFEKILDLAKESGIIANATFHMTEYLKHINEIQRWQSEGKLKGIGVSFPVTGGFPNKRDFSEALRKTENVVIHVIIGLVRKRDLEFIKECFEEAEKPAKMLLLGYKHFGRGAEMYSEALQRRIDYFESHYSEMEAGFHVISYDNLALEQLKMREKMTPEDWEIMYQGEEGTSSMYIDAVKGEFAVCSIAEERHPLREDVKGMFMEVKDEVHH